MEGENAPAPEAPVVEAPAVEAPPAPAAAPETPPAPSEETPAPTSDPSHIQPGQAPTDLDFDALLDELEAENEEEANANPPTEEEETPPAKPGDEVQPANKPAENTEEKPTTPVATTEHVDFNNIENYFNVEEDASYGIKAVSELRDPEAGESANDYFKSVTMPAIIQTVQNLSGFAQRNMDLKLKAEDEVQVAERNAMISEIDEMVASKTIPAYTKDAEGRVAPDSEGGKVIGAVLKFMQEFNSNDRVQKNPNLALRSFEQAYRTYERVQAKDGKKNEAAEATTSRKNRAALMGGNSNGRGANKSSQAQHIRKGQNVTDLDFEDLLG